MKTLKEGEEGQGEGSGPSVPAPLRSKKRKLERKGDRVETNEVTATAFFTQTEVQARELPSATVCALTSRLPAEASRLDGQPRMPRGIPGTTRGTTRSRVCSRLTSPPL